MELIIYVKADRSLVWCTLRRHTQMYFWEFLAVVIDGAVRQLDLWVMGLVTMLLWLLFSSSGHAQYGNVGCRTGWTPYTAFMR